MSEYITPVMYSDISGTYAVFNNYIGGSHSLANHVNKTSQSFKLIYDPYISTILGNVSYTITESDKTASLFYTYSSFGTASAKYGAGINLAGWIGLYGFVSTPGDFGMGVQITPWVHASGQIGLSGIGVSVGINIGNTAHDISVNVGWVTVGIFVIATLPIPGARAVATTAAAIIIVVGIIQYGDGGYYF
ncbi:MAG: hypothetical protein JEZ05_02130 [Tenericutes bacterium]|nr:hypothetical protein [Mycoplasmatota bacterium]